MKVTIETVPHKEQRYPTVGDWQWDGNDLTIKVSEIPVPEGSGLIHKSVFLVALHEFIEANFCRMCGITTAEVDAFDMAHPELAEPGDDLGAPYHDQHVFAESIERIVAHAIQMPWMEHETIIAELGMD